MQLLQCPFNCLAIKTCVANCLQRLSLFHSPPLPIPVLATTVKYSESKKSFKLSLAAGLQRRTTTGCCIHSARQRRVLRDVKNSCSVVVVAVALSLHYTYPAAQQPDRVGEGKGELPESNVLYRSTNFCVACSLLLLLVLHKNSNYAARVK